MLRTIGLLNYFFVFGLVIVGGLLHHSGAALNCPDWPLCYGQWDFGANTPNALTMFHRFMATVVGFLLIAQVIGIALLRREKKDLWDDTFRFGLLSLLILLLQGALGAATALLKLPTLVSTFHFLMSMSFLLMLQTLNRQIQVGLGEKIICKFTGIKKWDPTIKHLLLFTLFLFFLVAVSGAMVRHVGASSACGLGTQAALQCFDTNSSNWVIWPSVAKGQLNMFHRLSSLLAGALLLLTLFRLLKASRFLKVELGDTARDFWFKAFICVVLLLAQMNSGISVIVEYLQIRSVVFHQFFAYLQIALIWGLVQDCAQIEQQGLRPQELHTIYSDFFNLAKPRLALLVMVTSLVGLLLSEIPTNFFQALVGLILIFLVVMGSTALNCFYESEVDAMMERTKDRPLPAGRMSKKFVAALGIGLLLISIPGIWYFINDVTAILALIAFVVYVWIYTPLKRKSPAAVFIGAIPGAIPPVLGMTLSTAVMNPMAWCLFAFLFIWQIPHFLAISIFNANDYQRARILVYPNIVPLKSVIRGVFFLTFLLAATSLVPYWMGILNERGFILVLMVGFIFLGQSALGLRMSERDDILIWAKQYFWGSIVYLPVVLGIYMVLA